ncbi:MAG: DUF1492 domain-containing protein [Clostridia bacterium]|nr:DUF1492 domain-containing protein [Clostridia bacterium]
MTAKEWLRQGRKLEQEVRTLREQKDQAFALVCGSSISYGSDRVQASCKNTAEDKLITYLKYANMLESKIVELLNYRAEMIKAIGMVNDVRYRILLTAYYVNCNTWEQVAELMVYDLRWVHRLHGEALKAIESHYKSMI